MHITDIYVVIIDIHCSDFAKSEQPIGLSQKLIQHKPDSIRIAITWFSYMSYLYIMVSNVWDLKFQNSKVSILFNAMIFLIDVLVSDSLFTAVSHTKGNYCQSGAS